MNECTTILRCRHHPDSASCTSGCLVDALGIPGTVAAARAPSGFHPDAHHIAGTTGTRQGLDTTTCLRAGARLRIKREAQRRL